MKASQPKISNSTKLWEKTKRIIPAGTQTLSKGPTQFVQGVVPVYLKEGKGCYVWDIDGNKYIDLGMACRSVNLGYAYPAVNRAVIKQLKDGVNFTLMHPLETEVAEMLIDAIPCAEEVRYGKNGSDATTAAVRVARAYTKRDRVAMCGYHGWQDWCAVTTERKLGIPKALGELTFAFQYNNIDSLKELFERNPDEIACVIMEPVGVIPPRKNFLSDVKKVAHKNGAILIFDELITGFRMSLGGAQEYFNVIPDLATFGKAMANGMPISALVGRKEIMDVLWDVFFSFTFGGEALSLAAAKATMQEISDKKVISFIWDQGDVLLKGYNKLALELGLGEVTKCVGYAPNSSIEFYSSSESDKRFMKSIVQQEMIRRGVLWPGYHPISFSHKLREINYVLEAFEDSLRVLRKAVDEKKLEKYLDGKPVEPVFRKPVG